MEHMNTAEFARRSGVTPQIVRAWIRAGRLVEGPDGLLLADGYVLERRTSLVRGGCGGAEVRGANRRTLQNWIKVGKVYRGEDGVTRTAPGWSVTSSYRVARRSRRVWR